MERSDTTPLPEGWGSSPAAIQNRPRNVRWLEHKPGASFTCQTCLASVTA